jgi:ribosomal protein L37AE/L43A
MASKKKEAYIEWSCPYCGTKYNAPETAALFTTCQNCGKRFYTSGIEVENKESTKLYEEMKKRRKKEIEADMERE